MNTTIATTSLYVNENGAIRCVAHAGYYFNELYSAMPERNDYQTPCDTWDKVRTDFIVLWAEEFNTAPKCGMCV